MTVVVSSSDARLTAGPGELALADATTAPLLAALADPGRLAVTVTLDGRRLRGRLARRTRAGVVVVSRAVAPAMSVTDQLHAVAAPADVAAALADCPLLAGRGGDRAGVLSGGERQALGWVRARLLRPRVAVLDRATRGFDPVMQAWASDVVAGWQRGGVHLLVHAGGDGERAWARD